MTHTFQISGMTCSSCVARVKNELLKLGDIVSADVQLGSPQAVIKMSKHIDRSRLQAAIENAGAFTITASAVDLDHTQEEVMMEEKTSYFPIILIFGYIGLVSTLVQVTRGSFSWIQWMGHFMSGFFLVFSFFKLMNLQGFADGYRTYDVVARKFPAWGFIYPFVELGLGIALLTGFDPVLTNMITLLVMGVSMVGVVQSLLKKQSFQCACLGTVFRLPLGKVTLLEDLLMVVMSGVMLIAML